MTLDRRQHERRAMARFDVVGDLPGLVVATERLTLRNVGRGGALVEAAWPLPEQFVHQIRLFVLDEVIEVHARARWVKTVSAPSEVPRHLIGLEFVDVAPETVARLDRLLAEGGG